MAVVVEAMIVTVVVVAVTKVVVVAVTKVAVTVAAAVAVVKAEVWPQLDRSGFSAIDGISYPRISRAPSKRLSLS